MGDSTPICRCRVLYLGSAVPRQSKDGLQGIQEPLKSLYPSEGAIGAKGIDSWLSVWSNGILLENVDENLKQITRFFPIESLHYCAAVRQVLVPENDATNPEPKFLPLDSPFARMPRAQHPPIFAAILRRTTGIKVLECHVFICKREAAANALVRCCFHAYADNSYARQLETGSTYGTLKSANASKSNADVNSRISNGQHSISMGLNSWPTGSTMTINSVGKRSNGQIPNETRELLRNSDDVDHNAAAGYTTVKSIYDSSADINVVVDDGDASIYNDENHKIWNSSQDPLTYAGIESPYEVFSGQTYTLGRTMRARQISEPIEVPPPPIKHETNTKKKNKRPSKYAESQSLSGTLVRPKPITVHQRMPAHAPPTMIYSIPPHHGARQYHTISHRGFPFPGLSSLPQYNSGIAAQSQLIPSPIPTAVPTSVLVQKQFATLQSTRSKKKKNKKNGSIPVGMPVVPPIFAYSNIPQVYQQPAPVMHPLGGESQLVMSNRKLAASMGNGLDDCGISRAESPEGTGIYRRKGHMNERAFSYSIRQEHRSRSHGSLASLQFNPPDMKKEREIAQMVAGLSLNDNHQQQNELLLDRKKLIMNNSSCINGNTPIYCNNNMEQSSSIRKMKK